MYKLPHYDMYDFIDDGKNKSLYTILNEYHPNLKKDFSLANLLNHLPEVGTTPAQITGFLSTYEKNVAVLIKTLQEKTRYSATNNGTGLSEQEKKDILEELKTACEEIPECKSFVSIEQFLNYAQETISNPDMKTLRDVIVNHSVGFLSKESASLTRTVLIKSAYLAKAQEKAKSVNHMSRKPGEYPEVDKLQALSQMLQKNHWLEEYDEFYDEAMEQIVAAALKAMEKARTEVVCKRKRSVVVRKEINPSLSANSEEAAELPISAMFDELKRIPRKGENEWHYESLSKPELLCDLEANYSENGEENQRVIAFRYGRLKYKCPSEIEGFNIDRTSEMPELIGISRIGKEGTRNYFVLMPPIDRLIFRPVGEKPQDPGEKLYRFSVTQDVQVPTRSGMTKIERQTRPTNIVDAKTGQRLNTFKNKDIPENLKEFFVKVYFSDEYLSNAIEHNARYIGSVVETDRGPVIRTADIEKLNLSAAHYAMCHPGTVDGVPTKTFDRYCRSYELDAKQYNLVSERERRRKLQQKKNETPSDDGAR